MRTKKAIMAGMLAVHVIFNVAAQGTFQNLGFESASPVAIPGDPYRSVQFDSAFPGWIGYVGGVQETYALSNNYFLDTSGISIIDRSWPHYFGPTSGLISGNYTALLFAGLTLSVNPVPADTTLSQTSLVPVAAESLRFRSFLSPFVVELGGQRLALTALESGTNYTVYGANIHAWQGQVARLDFTLVAGRPHVVNGYAFLDSIQFSSEPIPEPGVFALIGLGLLIFGWRLFSKLRS